MDFKRLYENADRRAADALISLWSNGNKPFQDYIRYLLSVEEPLLADPVFQSTFPWEPAKEKMADLQGLFRKEFIMALDKATGEYRFEKDRIPYVHQLKSWNALLMEKKSIIVTSGTGSGKTECFMIPVLHDLYEQSLNGNREGVGALFLYPLNALMGSQRYRMLAWTKALKGLVRFAVYNGKTPDTENSHKRENALPEVIDRDTIRSAPPQILFTNPTMLEYMLIRQKDQPIIDKSKKKLRWILLDEAHTFTGSVAAEMAMLLRRVLDAFEMNIEDVRFAATSATIGGGNEKQTNETLKKFLADLSGKKISDIEVIGGKRIFNKDLPQPAIHTSTYEEFKSASSLERQVSFEVHNLRSKIINTPALTLKEIGDHFGCNNKSSALELVNHLSDSGKEALVPLRAHLFIRTIPGIFACTNPACSRHSDIRPADALGAFTTKLTSSCLDCGFPMLEVVGCRCCGTHYFKGQIDHNSNRVRLTGAEIHESFVLDDLTDEDSDTDDDENAVSHGEWNDFWMTKLDNVTEEDRHEWFPCGINKEGIKIDQGPFWETNAAIPTCPICGENLERTISYRAGAPFLSRILLPTFLEEAPPAEPQSLGQLWEGRKMLAFTDNRQGTARSAAQINAEIERFWIRTRIFHYLAKERLKQLPTDGVSTEILKELDIYKAHPDVPAFVAKIQEIEDRIAASKNPELIVPEPVKWQEFHRILQAWGDFDVLSKLTSRNGGALASKDNYASALLWDQFGRRPRRENSPETLGLVKLSYPELDKLLPSSNAKLVGLSAEEWRSFLKICIDFFVRENTFVHLPDSVSPLLTQHYRSGRVFPPKSKLYKKIWPQFEQNKKRQRRLITLLCAGLGYHDRDLMSTTDIDIVDSLLLDAWNAIKPMMIGSDVEGYCFDLERYAHFQLLTNAYICPVTNRFLDTVFRGYTPWIKGYITQKNIQRYKVSEQIVRMPFFKFPNGEDNYGKKVEREQIFNWIQDNYKEIKEKGLWSDLYERIFLDYPIFMAGEHTAQQKDTRLRQLERDFESGRLNFLSCSTTMEMGVDIGGISMVMMTNVPPKPANYLQRAGRAGRRGEARSLAVTFCASNPIGEEAMVNPKWALEHKVDTPRVSFNSPQLIQRHINALLFGMYVRCAGGISIKETVGIFFGEDGGDVDASLQFSAWVAGSTEEVLTAIDKLKHGTKLSEVGCEVLMARTQEHLDELRKRTTVRLKMLNDSIIHLSSNGYTESSPAVKALNHEIWRFKNQHLLKYLVEEEFLPGAGIPTGIMEFNTVVMEDLRNQQENSRNEDNSFRSADIPSYHFTRALTEYAPGRDVVIDGWTYKSAGIMLKSPFNEKRILKIRCCSKCGHQQIISGDFNQPCIMCGANTFRGISSIGGSFTEVIEPAGFAVDLLSNPSRKVNTIQKTQYVKPLLLNMEGWPQQQTAPVEVRIGGEHSEIMYYNSGNGNGFAVCTSCGRTSPMYYDNTDHHGLAGHKRLRGGKEKNDIRECSGNDQSLQIRTNVVLAGRIQTDICEIRIREKDKQLSGDDSLLTTLAVALKWEFTRRIGIEDGEIDFGIKQNLDDKDFYRSIFFFDTAKGGAGYSSQIPLMIDKLIIDAIDRLEKCTCSKSCTHCLVDRFSQWNLEKLNRHTLISWYKEHKSEKQVPSEFKDLYEKITIELCPFEQSLNMRIAAGEVNEIRLFMKGDIRNWDIDEWSLTRELKRRSLLGTKIRFIVDNWISSGEPVRDFSVYSQVTAWAEILSQYENDPVLSGFRPLAQVVYSNGLVYSWLTSTNDCLPSPNEHWGSYVPNTFYMCASGSEQLTCTKIPVPVLKPDTQRDDCFYRAEKMVLNKFGTFTLRKWQNKIPNFEGMLKSKTIDLYYSDTYLKNPQGCILLSELVGSLITLFKVQIKSINLNFSQFFLREPRKDNRISTDFETHDHRDAFVFQLLSTCCPNVNVQSIPKHQMEHFRYLELETDEYCITARPDGGIENGWVILNQPPWNFPFTESVEKQVQSYKIQRDRVFVGPHKDVNLLTTLVIEKIETIENEMTDNIA